MLTLQALTCFEGLRYPTQLRVECAPMQIVKQPVTLESFNHQEPLKMLTSFQMNYG